MKDIKEITSTELLKLINDSKFEHEKIKAELLTIISEYDELGVKINEKLNDLDIIEKQYINLIDEMNER